MLAHSSIFYEEKYHPHFTYGYVFEPRILSVWDLMQECRLEVHSLDDIANAFRCVELRVNGNYRRGCVFCNPRTRGASLHSSLLCTVPSLAFAIAYPTVPCECVCPCTCIGSDVSVTWRARKLIAALCSCIKFECIMVVVWVTWWLCHR